MWIAYERAQDFLLRHYRENRGKRQLIVWVLAGFFAIFGTVFLMGFVAALYPK